jgi:PhnB protein
MRYREMPDSEDKSMVPPSSDDKIMHLEMRIGDTQIMASDGMCAGQPKFEGFGLTLSVADDAEAQRLFGILADGGQVHMPLMPTFFASTFGMVADRFGVT